MTYELCKKSILNRKGKIPEERWVTYVESMKEKLDVFLLNDRITQEEYNDLKELIVS